MDKSDLTSLFIDDFSHNFYIQIFTPSKCLQDINALLT